MICVVIEKRADGAYSSIKTKGHALFADAGKDVVCAAASVLIINTVNAVDELTSCSIELLSEDKEKGIIEVSFPEGTDEKGTLLMDALVQGLKGIAKDHSENLDLRIS